jgi:putative sterol carrier protein
MAYPFAGEAWLKAVAEVLNTDEHYADVARNWEGDMLVLVEPDPGSAPGEKAIGAYLDLWHGKCRRTAAYLEGDPAMPKPAFTLRATRGLLMRIMEGKLDPMQAMVTRKLKVEGSLSYMMRNVPTVLDFVRCCQRVEIAG